MTTSTVSSRRSSHDQTSRRSASGWPVRLAVVVAGLSVVLTLRDPVPLANAWMVVAAFALLIGIGEYYRFGIDEGRQLAPMTLGAGLAFALTSRSWNIDLTTLSPSPIIAVSGLAMVCGALPHRVRGRSMHPDEMAARFLAIAVTAVIFRWLPLWLGHTLLDVDAAWVGSRWLVAVVLAAVAAVGLITFLVLSAFVEACLLYTSPSPRDRTRSRMPSSA